MSPRSRTLCQHRRSASANSRAWLQTLPRDTCLHCSYTPVFDGVLKLTAPSEQRCLFFFFWSFTTVPSSPPAASQAASLKDVPNMRFLEGFPVFCRAVWNIGPLVAAVGQSLDFFAWFLAAILLDLLPSPGLKRLLCADRPLFSSVIPCFRFCSNQMHAAQLKMATMSIKHSSRPHQYRSDVHSCCSRLLNGP